MASAEVDSDLNMSKLSLHSNNSEDWDRSLVMEGAESQSSSMSSSQSHHTPRNSVAFPRDDVHSTPKASDSMSRAKGKRTLSELLKLHAEKGTDCTFTTEEASRLADVLGEWINAGSSPYEGEDDFFAHSHDNPSLPNKRDAPSTRPRGHSEATSRPSSRAEGKTEP